jgi:hypothetical protein
LLATLRWSPASSLLHGWVAQCALFERLHRRAYAFVQIKAIKALQNTAVYVIALSLELGK